MDLFTIFKIIMKLTEEFDLQYFVNIGKNSLNDTLQQEVFTEEERKFIESRCILKLDDTSPDRRLLGIDF